MSPKSKKKFKKIQKIFKLKEHIRRLNEKLQLQREYLELTSRHQERLLKKIQHYRVVIHRGIRQRSKVRNSMNQSLAGLLKRDIVRNRLANERRKQTLRVLDNRIQTLRQEISE
jgi:hypothetical protein